MSESTGRLFLVPAPLDFACAEQAPITDVLPAATLERAAAITHWVCENAKSARALLKRIDEIRPLAAGIREQLIVELPRSVHKKGDHGGDFDASSLLAPARAGHDMGLLSEAGMPAVADPGSSVVRAAHDAGVEVVPLVGPVSILLALAASGLNGQEFAFVGYLPQDASARTARVRELETLALKRGQTQLFIETPYRNASMWASLCDTLQPGTRLALAAGLTLPSAVVVCRPVGRWRGAACPVANNVPAVFAIGR